MKNILIILALLSLTGCFKKFGPDETTIMQGEALRLPPEYELAAPQNVKTIKTQNSSAQEQSKKILLGDSKNEVENSNVNSWILKNAGGNNRVKNIKQILKEDIAEEKN
jgi:predicted small lipoprotein YifL